MDVESNNLSEKILSDNHYASEQPDVGAQSSLSVSKVETTISDAILAGCTAMVSLFVQVLTLSAVTGRVPDTALAGPLPDRIADTAWISDKYGFIVNYCLFAQLITCGMHLAFYFQKNCEKYAIITRFMLCWATSMLGRTICFTLTSLPATDNQCQDMHFYRIKSVLGNTMDIFGTLGAAGIHCGDLLYSAHTILLTLPFLALLTYSPYRIVHVVSCILVPFGTMYMIITRHHYSTDIFLGFFMTSMLWKITPERFTFRHLNILG